MTIPYKLCRDELFDKNVFNLNSSDLSNLKQNKTHNFKYLLDTRNITLVDGDDSVMFTCALPIKHRYKEVVYYARLLNVHPRMLDRYNGGNYETDSI